MNDMVEYRIATRKDLEQIWAKNVEENYSDARWIDWKEKFIRHNETGAAITFVVIFDGEPVGEGTLILSPDCDAINGNTQLADNQTIANINALRIQKEHEGKGYISTLVSMMEQAAIQKGITRLTIGVEAKETRNLGIYLHWGYDSFVSSAIQDDELVLYYAKDL